MSCTQFWKSCDGQKPSEGSNPSHSAIKTTSFKRNLSFFNDIRSLQNEGLLSIGYWVRRTDLLKQVGSSHSVCQRGTGSFHTVQIHFLGDPVFTL